MAGYMRREVLPVRTSWSSTRRALLGNRSPQFRTTSQAFKGVAAASVSAHEVNHFDALASDWWSPQGSSRLLHLMNPLRHDFIHACWSSAGSRNTRIRYLDVGCGGGIFAESAARQPDTDLVLGIDPTPGVIAIAKNHARRDPFLHRSSRLAYLRSSIENLPVPQDPSELFDILSLFEVIEHVQQPDQFLRRCLPFVKPGGWIVGSTIARTYTSWLTTKFIAEDLLHIVPVDTHDWSKYVNVEELRAWFIKQQDWQNFRAQEVVYAPGLGWQSTGREAATGNYFFGVRRIC